MTDHPVKGIDHVFAIAKDLDASQRAFERLGFTVSPRGYHSKHMGTANHTIMFPRDYFELLGIIAPTPHNVLRQEVLEQDGEGLRAIACRIDDAAAAETALEALGIKTNGLNDFTRPVELPDGSEGQASFTTLQFHPDITPEGIMFMCQHRTRETVWVPALLEHANGAAGLAGVVTRADDPAAKGPEYAKMFAAGSVEPVEGGVRVTTGENSAPILVLTPDAVAAYYAGIDLSALPKTGHAALRIFTRDIDKARSVLEAAGVAVHATADGIAVAPADASGLIVEFVPA